MDIKQQQTPTDAVDVFEELTFDDSQSPTDIGSENFEGELIKLTLDELVPYDLNPRQSINPLYEEIKASIRERGLDNPPNVTRRSSTDPWMIADGGNTRLQILQDLYKESMKLARQSEDIDEKKTLDTLADSFYRIRCRCKPWRGEINSIVGHVVENELRGDMLFIEKALTVSQLKGRFEDELRQPDTFSQYEFLGLKAPLQPCEGLSFRQLSALLKAVGWDMHPATLTRFMHTADELVSLIPLALWTGAGHQLVTNIKKLGKAYLNFMKARSEGGESHHQAPIATATTDCYPLFEALWAESLGANDAEKIDLLAVRKYMEQRLSERYDLPTDYIRLEIDALISGVAPRNTTEKCGQSVNIPSLSSKTNTTSNTNNSNKADAAIDDATINNNGAASMKQTMESEHKTQNESDTKPMGSKTESRLEQPVQALRRAVIDMASQWKLEQLIHKNTAPKYILGIEVAAPETAFLKNDTAAFIWLKLCILCQPWFGVVQSAELTRCIQLAFGEDAILSDIILASYRALEMNYERRSLVDALRQLEDSASTIDTMKPFMAVK